METCRLEAATAAVRRFCVAGVRVKKQVFKGVKEQNIHQKHDERDEEQRWLLRQQVQGSAVGF